MKELTWPNYTNKNSIELKLDRVKALLGRLNNPEQKLKNIIHFAGTNGKGSTLTFLSFLLDAHKFQVNCYTSPHLVKFNERIKLNNKDIDDDNLSKILRECQTNANAIPSIKVTFFEGTTVAAFLAFAESQADYNLIETGLGGRLDATNIFNHKKMAVITPIDYDHMEFLGNSLEEIAKEKIAIATDAEQIIIAKQKGEINNFFKTYLKKRDRSKIKFFAEDYNFYIENDNFIYKQGSITLKINIAEIGLKGEHQYINLATALCCFFSLKEYYKIEAIKQAVKKTYWPGRLESIRSGKFYDIISKDSAIYIDGGHNLSAALSIEKWLNENRKKYDQVKLIFNMAKDKKCQEFLEIISKDNDELYYFSFSHDRELYSKNEIAEIAQNLNIKFSNEEKLIEIIKQKNKKTLYLICGSLYAIGEFKKQNQ